MCRVERWNISRKGLFLVVIIADPAARPPVIYSVSVHLLEHFHFVHYLKQLYSQQENFRSRYSLQRQLPKTYNMKIF